MLEHKIQDIWYQKSCIRFILWPFSIIFKIILVFRHALYRLGLKKVIKFHCPVIVVGNITVGGTGKTPLVLALANFLQSEGYHPGIISRGYKGTNQLPQFVNEKSDPEMVGDEPVLLAKRTGCPLVVCKDRVVAAKKLLEETHCDVVLSDDGLQHLALGRDIEIAVINSHVGLGNGFLLPAGPLREPVNRLNTVDFCVVNGQGIAPELDLKNRFIMTLKTDHCVNIKNDTLQSIKDLSHKALHAVAGIGFPDQFFYQLKALGLSFVSHPFPDHYAFEKQDFDFLEENAWVVMTEKDAVKCKTFADERYWYIPIHAELPVTFFEALSERLKYETQSQ